MVVANDFRIKLQGQMMPPQANQITGINSFFTTCITGRSNSFPLPFDSNRYLTSAQTGIDITTPLLTLREKYIQAATNARVYETAFSFGNGFDFVLSSLKRTAGSAYIDFYVYFNGNYYTMKDSGTDEVIAVDAYTNYTGANVSFYRFEGVTNGFGFGFFLRSSSSGDGFLNHAFFRGVPSTNQAYPYIVPNFILSDDPYATDDNQTPSGGYGDFDFSGDDVTPPSLPSVSAAQVGFVSLWNPSEQEMHDLANYLWTGTFDLTNFKKLFTDPMECILSVGIVPVTPTTGTSTEIVFGGSSHSGVSSKPITDQFVTKDFGRLRINGQSASAMDYSPYAKASIFLPYCGTYALDVDEIMDADIDLEYHIDIYTGACVAYLTITRTNSDGSTLHSTLYQFTGNVLASIPVTGADHSQFIQSMLFMGSAIAATVATSGAGAPAIEGAAASGDVAGASALNAVTAGSAINTVMSMKPNVLHSGNLSSTAGFLGQQKPYVTITWSNLCRPEDEYKLVGLPSQKSGKLSTFSGFTIVSAVHMDSILCTDAERAEIERLLYKGVIL